MFARQRFINVPTGDVRHDFPFRWKRIKLQTSFFVKDVDEILRNRTNQNVQDGTNIFRNLLFTIRISSHVQRFISRNMFGKYVHLFYLI